MLNTLHLKTFIAVIDHGNYSAAAEYLHMSQPTVTLHIRALEDELENIRLFQRVGQQMRPTPAGDELIDIAREMLALAARAEENIKSLHGQVSGQIALGCGASVGERLLPALCARFRTHFPAIALSSTIAPNEQLIEWLGAQQLHVLILDEHVRRRGWESLLLGIERIVAIAPRNHALLTHNAVPATELRGLPLVLPRDGTPQRRTIEDALRRRNVGAADLVVALETDSTEMMLAAVRAGLGIAFVPQLRLPRTRDLAIIDLAGIALQQEWYAVRQRDRSAPRALQEFFAFVASEDARKIVQREGLKSPTLT